MILGFDFLGFQAIKRFPTKNRIFLHIMQSTITNNSFLLVFYSYVLVFYLYVTGMYLVCTRMLLVCTRICSYVTRMYLYVTRMYSYVTRMYLYVTRMYSCGVLVTIPLCVVLSPLDDSMLHYSNKQNIRITGTTCTLLLTRVPIGCIKNTLVSWRNSKYEECWQAVYSLPPGTQANNHYAFFV